MVSKRSASFWCAVSLAALARPLLYPTDPHNFGRLSTLGSPSKMNAAQRFKHHPFLEVASKQLKAGVRMAVAKEPRKKEGGKLQTITAHPHFGNFYAASGEVTRGLHPYRFARAKANQLSDPFTRWAGRSISKTMATYQ